MSNSGQQSAAASDRAAELNEQVAEGHEWAARANPNSESDLHSDAATEHRRTAGKGRSEAEATRNRDDQQIP
ncbi:hypothetical protein [Mycobacterium asiaticum]|uniref:Uncharacterized protein n=1 Tax=Mycobacterium asiaticum TaxID=1790 RepID=A0A1A3NA59_MYCAS|nr:hypothetical protein [Mycobacterium asiaticum]OBK17934.1 hypothetical protein A5636_22205 [Mycobacterium asiaticum]